MTVQAWIIMDEAMRDDAVALNNSDFALDPLLINNPLSNNLGEGVLVNKYVVPARLLNIAGYEAWYELFENTPIRTMDSEVLFALEVIEE